MDANLKELFSPVDKDEVLEIYVGALCPSMGAQLKKYKLDKGQIRKLQKMHDAIVILSVQGILTDTEVHTANKRFLSYIKKR